ncbi:hypothetical protein NHH03_10790 [Stieleria sp. TO1_6]|uniref:hypothetical protein n=1 Tax=Stieleria tagensis TaxID=2956795 RepID=UPI00209B0548|nr:hypothetical protein [Stieleria tagensis]MCO8122226.1 hypothetical protein [Stieleria tagensis]
MAGQALLTALLTALMYAPPIYDPTAAVVDRLRSVGMELQGRDPCAGTGLCCGLLPVYTVEDVHYVTLPNRGIQLADLRVLSQFPNLQQVRAARALSLIQYETVAAAVPAEAWIFCRVRHGDGTLKRIAHHQGRPWVPDEDTNGDGVVNDDDQLR